MDYAKSGYPNASKQAPKAKRHTSKGAPTRPGVEDKAALLAKMKAAAEAKKA